MTNVILIMLAKKNNINSVASVANKILIAISLMLVACAARQQLIPVYEVSDPERNLHSYMMSGNYISLQNMPEGYRVCSLNPGRIHRGSEGVYFALNLIYKSEIDSITISVQDTLLLVIDGLHLSLIPYDIQQSGRETSAFYEIDPYDLVDLGNANLVSVHIGTQDSILSARLSQENIYNFKRFAARYVLLSDHQPHQSMPAKRKNWGFVSLGLGSGYELWLGKYTDLLTSRDQPHVQDYLAVNAGYSSFSYDIKGFRRFWIYDPEIPGDSTLAIRFWSDETVHKNYPYLGFMYGVKLEQVVSDWSLETGITVQYFFLPQWRQAVDSVYVPEQDKHYPQKLYHLTSGTQFDGFSAGVFIQLGGLWGRLDTQKSWAVGLALPVPWW